MFSSRMNTPINNGGSVPKYEAVLELSLNQGVIGVGKPKMWPRRKMLRRSRDPANCTIIKGKSRMRHWSVNSHVQRAGPVETPQRNFAYYKNSKFEVVHEYMKPKSHASVQKELQNSLIKCCFTYD